MYKRILIPTDGSECSEQGVRHGVKLAKALQAEVVFLHVVEPLPPALTTSTPSTTFPGFSLYVDDYFGDLKKIGQDALDTAQRMAEKEGVRARPLQVGPSRPAETIAKMAETRRCDLIVMGSHGRSGLPRFILGSVTEGVLRRATQALLVVHCSKATPRRGRRRRR